MNATGALVLSLLAVVLVALLAAVGKVDGDAAVAFIGGVLIPSPVVAATTTTVARRRNG